MWGLLVGMIAAAIAVVAFIVAKPQLPRWAIIALCAGIGLFAMMASYADFKSIFSGSKAAASADPSPPPPPPFRDCTADEENAPAEAMIAFVANNNQCVINHGELSATVKDCQVEHSTGLTHATTTVSFDDTYVEAAYAITIRAVFTPHATNYTRASVEPNEAYNIACGRMNLVAAGLCAMSDNCRGQ